MVQDKSTYSRKGWKLKRHGLSGDPLWNRWRRMIQRCHGGRSAKSGYAGRGISVCQRWRESFDAFVEDMGHPPTPKHQIERIDNDGNYEPGNCCWATPAEQARNRRDNKLLTIDGITKPLSEWLKASTVSRGTVEMRLKRGWPPAIALTAPAHAYGYGRFARPPLHTSGTDRPCMAGEDELEPHVSGAGNPVLRDGLGRFQGSNTYSTPVSRFV